MIQILKRFLFNSYKLIIVPLIVASLTPIWISWSNKINLNQSIKLINDFIRINIKVFFNYKVSIWIVLIILFILLLLIKFINFINNNSYPDWYYNFNQFEFKEWLFHWEYNKSSTFTIKNLRPICFCKCNLVKKSKIGNIHYGSPRLYCPNCNKVFNIPNSNDLEELNCLIIHHIKTNKYKE